jgi:hypothetical protein
MREHCVSIIVLAEGGDVEDDRDIRFYIGLNTS